MAIIPKNQRDFTVKVTDVRVTAENTVVIRGGATVVEDQWVVFGDQRIDVKQVVSDYVRGTSRRLFNKVDDILYVLIVLDKTGLVEVIPNISYKKLSFGDMKVFPDLSGKIPVMLVKLQQDGSNGLTGIKTITDNDINVYNGYGNFTTKGTAGETGPQGVTGNVGLTGQYGITGPYGYTGAQGHTGIMGHAKPGITGVDGLDGAFVRPYVGATFYADFSASDTTPSPSGMVTFTDLSVGPIASWYWSFGDSGISGDQNPSHSYTPGSYTVDLTIKNFDGSTSVETKIDYIVV